MQISVGIYEEAIFFGISVVVGMALFLLYDFFRILRRIVKHGILWISIEDIIYWLICTVTVFLLLYHENDGRIRGYALGGILIGMGIYYLLLSRFFVKINVFIIKKILGIIKKILSIIFGPFIKYGRKILVFIRKQLKKVWKTVKICLCKL